MQKDSAAPATVGAYRPSRLLAVLPVLYLLVVTLACYNTALLPSRTFLPADIVLLTPPWSHHAQELDPGFHAAARAATDPLYQFYPARKYLADSLRADRIPLWNPYIFCGMPFAGDGQSAAFYPLNWLFAVLPLSSAFGWVAALHTFLAGLFFWLYGRRIGWGDVASLAGATVWMLCGVMVAWQMWQVVDAALCWLPLCLYCWEGWRTDQKSSQLVGLSAALAMSLLAGHFQFAFYVWLTTLVYGLFTLSAPLPSSGRACDPSSLGGPPGRGGAAARHIVALIGAFVLAAGFAAVQLAASVDLLLHSPRTHEPLAGLLTTAMPLPELIITLAPGLFGGVKDSVNAPYIYGTNNFWELTSYFGAVALVFAVFGARLRQANHLSLFWFGLGLFALLMGTGSPLFTVFYYAVPLFKSFHGVVRIFVLLDFAIAALCAMGIKRLIDDENLRNRMKPLHVFGAVFVLLLIGIRFAVTSTPRLVGYILTHQFVASGYLPAQLGVSITFVAAACLLVRYAPRRFAWLALPLVAADMLLFAVGINVGAPANVLYPSMPDIDYITAQHTSGRVLTLGDGDPTHYFQKMIPNTAMSVGLSDVSGSDPLMLSLYDRYLRAANHAATGADWPEGVDMAALPDARTLRQMDVRYIITPRPIKVENFEPVSAQDVYVYVRESSQLDSSVALSAVQQGPLCPVSSSESLILRRLPVNAPIVNTHVIADPGWKLYAGRPGVIQPWRIVDNAFIGVPRTMIQPTQKPSVLVYMPTPILLGLYISILSLGASVCLLAYTLRKTAVSGRA